MREFSNSMCLDEKYIIVMRFVTFFGINFMCILVLIICLTNNYRIQKARNLNHVSRIDYRAHSNIMEMYHQ